MENYLKKLQMIGVLRTLGLLTNEQGIELLNDVNQNFTNSNNQKSQSVPPSQNSEDVSFFTTQSRKDLKDFFNNNFKQGGNFDEKKFAALVENLEKEAVNGYRMGKDFEQNLARSNDSAKGKLISQVQSANNTGTKEDRIFTREEIGKMSLEEFQKNEDNIMSQYEQGLIR